MDLSNVKSLLQTIVEISYSGHPDGRETRLELINRYAKIALKEFQNEGHAGKRETDDRSS